MRCNYNAFLHFSIDDFIDSLQWIYTNQPESIFDTPLLKALKKWNEKYLLSFDLYVFERKEGFSLLDLQDKYWNEFQKNASWLRFGWHQICPGEIKASVEEQIASAKRVEKMIQGKCGSRGLSRTLRLHRFQGDYRLIETLKEIGISVFLTSDCDERPAYDLSKEKLEHLKLYGGYRDVERGIFYRRTDIRLDNIGGVGKRAELIKFAKERINITPYYKNLEVFIREGKVADSIEEIEVFLEEAALIKKDLYINTGFFNRNMVFFTAVNLGYSFGLNIRTNTLIKMVSPIPVKYGRMRFSSIVQYKNEYWMIPWEESQIIIYDNQLSESFRMRLPYENDSGQVANCHRKVVQKGNLIWLLPTKYRAIVRIDMESKTVQFIDSFPRGVVFEDNKKMLFKNMELCGEHLFLFADACSHNLRININTNRIEVWNDDFNGLFGTMIDEDTALLSPTYDKEPLRIYHSGARTIESIDLPDDIWQGAHYYAFWYGRKVGEYVYIAPHEANAILRFDCREKTLKYIYLPKHDYKTLRPNPGFSGYDIFEVEDEVWVMAYMGNQIVRIDKNGGIVGIIDAKIALGELTNPIPLQGRLYMESIDLPLGDFTRRMRSVCCLHEERELKSSYFS